MFPYKCCTCQCDYEVDDPCLGSFLAILQQNEIEPICFWKSSAPLYYQTKNLRDIFNYSKFSCANMFVCIQFSFLSDNSSLEINKVYFSSPRTPRTYSHTVKKNKCLRHLAKERRQYFIDICIFVFLKMSYKAKVKRFKSILVSWDKKGFICL